MIKLKAIPFKKGDVYFILIPKLATFVMLDEYVEYIEIPVSIYNEILSIIEEKRNISISKKGIKKIFIINTTYCDGRCKYCYEHKNRKDSYFLNLKDLKSTLNMDIFSDSLENAIIYGGEPFINEEIFDIILYLKNEKKCNSINVVTSLFFKDNIFYKMIEFCENNDIQLTISMDPNSESYPRIYNNINSYEFVKRRLKTILLTTNIHFGVRSTISEWAYDGLSLFNDLNSISKYKKVSVVHDISKGHFISYDKLNYFLNTWISNSDYIIDTLTHNEFSIYHTIFSYTYNKLFKYKSGILDIMKNCDGGRGRFAITPNNKLTLCNEDVLSEKYDVFSFGKSTIYPFRDVCRFCDFENVCGFFCFNMPNKFMEQACLFRKRLFLESLRQFIKRTPTRSLIDWIKYNNIYIDI